jgi:hypothetical protein
MFDAVQQITTAKNGNPFFLSGFSPGGNFTLRIARQCATSAISGLWQVVSISPVQDPNKATDRIDNSRLILKYLLKLGQSPSIKQQLYPRY